MSTTNGHNATAISDNQTMTEPLRHILRAPFTRRVLAVLAYLGS
jgi:hypothetical protein